jgi:hypothetical protein
MSRTRFKKALLVAADDFPGQLLSGYECVKHITNVNSIFPSLYELNPNLVIFDYDFIGKDLEKIIRRIKLNKFYSKLKICCYKSVPNEETDSLLTAIGLDQLIYKEDLLNPQKDKTPVNNLSNIFETPFLKWVTNVSN